MDQKLLSDQAEFASLMGGKTTFKSIFSRGNKSEQIQILEKDIPALQKEIDLLAEFLKVVLAAFTLSELPSFKKHKQLQYYTMMEHLSQNELRYLSAYGEFMRSIMEGLDSSQAS